MAGVKGRSGGRRPGAGRRPKAERYAAQIGRVEQQIADNLETLLTELLRLAKGGYERVEREYQSAGTVLIDRYEPILDVEGKPTGKTLRRKVSAYPNLAPHRLVMVKRKVMTVDGDRAA